MKNIMLLQRGERETSMSRRLTVGGLVAVIAAILIGVGLNQALQGTASSTTTETTNTFTSVTAPCSSPGVQCGSFSASISLVAASASNRNSTLTAVVTNTGNVNITKVLFYINGSEIAALQGIPVGNTMTYNVQIPASVSITSGQTYKVDVDSTIGNSGGPGNELYVTAH
jgi:alpha-L-arabinofuranosidase